MASLFARVFGSRTRTADAPREPLAQAPDADLESSLDERAALVFERWPAAQRAEYRPHARALLDASILLDEGRFREAREAFESLLAAEPDARFLLRDVGRARLATGDAAGAEAALRSFLARAAEAIPAELKLETHLDLVRIAEERGDVEGVFEELGAMVESLPGDPRPTFLLARALRVHGHPEEALEVWKSSASKEPPSDVLEEVGLCQVALGRLPEAERVFDEVVRRAKCRCGARVPEATAIALASIYERTGREADARELLASVGRAMACGH